MKRILWLLLFVASLAFADTPRQINLLINATATSAPQLWPGGIGVFTVTASSWSSATVALEYLGPDGVTYVQAGTNTNCTANCGGVFYLPPGKIEAVVTGTPSGVYAVASQVQTP